MENTTCVLLLYYMAKIVFYDIIYVENNCAKVNGNLIAIKSGKLNVNVAYIILRLIYLSAYYFSFLQFYLVRFIFQCVRH